MGSYPSRGMMVQCELVACTRLVLDNLLNSLALAVVRFVSVRRELQRILYGGRWWLPRVRAMVSQMSPRSPVVCPNTKRVQNEF